MKAKSKLIHLGSRRFIPANEIWYLSSKSNYTDVFLTNGEQFTSSTTLKILAERLGAFPSFIRINRQVLLNIENATRVEEGVYLLADNKEVKFSRRRARVNKDLVKPKKKGPKGPRKPKII